MLLKGNTDLCIVKPFRQGNENTNTYPRCIMFIVFDNQLTITLLVTNLVHSFSDDNKTRAYLNRLQVSRNKYRKGLRSMSTNLLVLLYLHSVIIKKR